LLLFFYVSFSVFTLVLEEVNGIKGGRTDIVGFWGSGNFFLGIPWLENNPIANKIAEFIAPLWRRKYETLAPGFPGSSV